MGIIVRSVRDINVDGLPSSIPFGNGELKMFEVTGVDGDSVDSDGTQELVYKGGELYHNYIIQWVTVFDGEERRYPIGTAKSFMDIFGLLKPRAEAIENYITERLPNEIAIIPTAADACADGHTIIFSNTYDAYVDVYGEDSSQVKAFCGKNGELKGQILEMINNHVYIRNVLAKLGQMIEQGFNEAYHEEAANRIVEIIMASRHMNKRSEIVGPSMSAVEDIFNMVRDKLYIQSSNRQMPELSYISAIPVFLQ
ncbi:MAG: hypothetical protein NC548_38930 [Lachnospiraceae bacterium]|nr:hypothetical protein [Lachnospiraceae bacterium]